MLPQLNLIQTHEGTIKSCPDPMESREDDECIPEKEVKWHARLLHCIVVFEPSLNLNNYYCSGSNF